MKFENLQNNLNLIAGELGGGVSSIADTLIAGHYRGRRHKSGKCPIANYVKARLSDVYGCRARLLLRVCVDGERVKVYSRRGSAFAELPLTSSQHGFVAMFDEKMLSAELYGGVVRRSVVAVADEHLFWLFG